jgi:type I restriction enzyme R subunit
MAAISEQTLEKLTLTWFEELGYTLLHGPNIAPGETAAERDDFTQVLLLSRLRAAIERLNPAMPEAGREEALRKLQRLDAGTLVGNNRAFHLMLRDGVPVEYQRADGSIAGDHARIIDFESVASNDWLAVDQYVVKEGQHMRRPDILVFLNGMPIALLELKDATNHNATIWSAFHQVQTYKAQVPTLFAYNELLVISDGLHARIGSLTANQEWFKVWRTIDGENTASPNMLELEVLVRGVFDRERLLELLHHFIAFEQDADRGTLHKLMAGYHQFHAVNKAVQETVRASGMTAPGSEDADRRVGVVWHTQGSGKSLSMLFYAGRIIRHPAMQNPTLVILTDRNDLDDQLFGQFQRCHELLGQMPTQAENREHLRELLSVASGGVVFTTIQKFLPEDGARMPALSQRRNIVVVADEAHRSQYDLIDGLARHMRDALPSASFIGFTGTPIETNDANTRAVFGDYISIYDIQAAVADKATVPIYYESRISKLSLNESALPRIDQEFDEITEGEEQDSREKLKSKWAAIEALVGEPKRVKLVAADLVAHFEKRLESMDGKAMVVCMSRRICIDLYNAIVALRPDWAGAPDDDIEAEKGRKCVVKVIMTGNAADGPDWQQHIRNKERRKKLASRFKDAKDPFRIVIVRDMWLTGFDAPCMHTMYVDKPMKGHGLMQAIARVNRVFRDKDGGLIVDYLGLADQLKRALATYTESGGKGDPTYDVGKAVEAMLEKHGIACNMLHGFNWSKWKTGTKAECLLMIPAAREHIMLQEDGKKRFVQVVTELSRAFALCAATEEATELRDDIAFFQTLQVAFKKQPDENRKSPEQIDAAVRQLISKAITTDGEVIDVFTAAGLQKPDISILSDQFLAEVRGLKHKNVAAELLEKLLHGEIKDRAKKNVAQAQLFSEKLKKTLNAYHNRAIATQEVLEELIKLAKEMHAAKSQGDELGLNEDEKAFYSALATNGSAREILGDKQLAAIAAELVTQVRKNASIDWNLREGARARMRVIVRRILKKFGYPPDLELEAVQKVLLTASVLCDELV